MKKISKNKVFFIFSCLAIAFFTAALVPKTFQNDTFFNISIGKYILNNGIDMQEHFSWVPNLAYTYSHWAFDIIIYLLYNCWNFTGIYVFTIIFSAIIAVTLFTLLSKAYKTPVSAFLVTAVSVFVVKDAFTARSQIISFLCFIIEIYCLEQFIETKKKRYPLILVALSIVIANFHAATWPLILVLFLPYLAAGFFNLISCKNIYTFLSNFKEKQLQKLDINSSEATKCKEDIEYYKKLAKDKILSDKSKLQLRNDYNFKNLIIVFIINSLTGLITPIHGVPYTYIIKSMTGTSNFENAVSIDYISEMQPIIPVGSLAFFVFLSLIIFTLAFMPTKIKVEHGFLILGLLIMTLYSRRYVYLLVLLSAFPICELISQCVNKDTEKQIENSILSFILCICSIIFLFVSIFNKQEDPYVDETKYPTKVVDYIKENVDYKNMRIYNSYDNGSYLMLNDIPVFIDSRLDVYCSEFNDTDVFKDYIYVTAGKANYENIFSKYDFTHILLYKKEIANQYITNDTNYKLLYEDEYFSFYQKLN